MNEFDDKTLIYILCLIGSLSLSAWLLSFVAPISPPPIAAFFLSLCIASFSMLRLFGVGVSRSMLITIGVVIFFSLRLIGLRDIWYPCILIALIYALDRIISGKNHT